MFVSFKGQLPCKRETFSNIESITNINLAHSDPSQRVPLTVAVPLALALPRIPFKTKVDMAWNFQDWAAGFEVRLGLMGREGLVSDFLQLLLLKCTKNNHVLASLVRLAETRNAIKHQDHWPY